MEFLKNNKTLVALGIAVVLALLGAFFKVDIPGLLNSISAISKQVNALDPTAEPAPAPVPAEPAQ